MTNDTMSAVEIGNGSDSQRPGGCGFPDAKNISPAEKLEAQKRCLFTYHVLVGYTVRIKVSVFFVAAAPFSLPKELRAGRGKGEMVHRLLKTHRSSRYPCINCAAERRQGLGRDIFEHGQRKSYHEDGQTS
jgi:hypothetical protein